MILALGVFVFVLLFFVLLRRGFFSRFSGSGNGSSLLRIVPADDQPPQASLWEKRLLADALDDHRRDLAKAKLFAELRAISEPGVAPSVPAAAAGRSASPFE